jgi:hypothetical protein
MKQAISTAGAIALAVVITLAGPARAEDPPPKSNDSGFPDLVGALKETPGCLGVETARTASGKQVIFAWFEDKKAALAWYHSDTHRAVMRQFFKDFKREGKPLASVPDDSGPIMAVASITLEGKPTADKLPFKQISIELYQPLGGGISIGGRFAPEKMKIPEKKDRPAK